ncbi:metalloregulator ArsR/SmtB family transcription factor [Mycobacterium sp. GA-2829]|uniref:ArsR/SmtB family transcription factor n=1 Tax=Mycobacterium sp. GA-2829 TaxID=1772283 RepID=UPI0007400C44|nr:metalloregulator ArsR/SmtB family transcription factor [Mycobacterium sp. GA-2829]KUI28580.1 ArsR family transcriptional regulator [Mycobacterium sp. GA-2829]
MDEVFKALADPNRRRLLDALNLRDGQTLRELCEGAEMTRQSVSKHLAVLEAAGLVRTERRGREKIHHLDAEPLDAMSDRWLRQYDRARTPTPASPEPAGEPADRPFVYTVYIRTTPERLWQAITGPSHSDRYLGHAVVSTWQRGATYTWVEGDRELDDPDQVILEVDPYRRLAFTFPTDRAENEPRSRVSFDIEPSGEQVALTLTHGGFAANSVVRQKISRIWPRKLSDLKSGLERR